MLAIYFFTQKNQNPAQDSKLSALEKSPSSNSAIDLEGSAQGAASSQKNLLDSEVLKNSEDKISNTEKSTAMVSDSASDVGDGVSPKGSKPGATKVISKVIDFDELRKRPLKPSAAQSTFSKSYKLIFSDVKLSEEPTLHKIKFEQELKDIVSVVLVAQSSDVDLKGLSFNEKLLASDREKVTSLFPQDWIKADGVSVEDLKQLEFTASSLDGQGSIDIYLQVIGEDE